MLSGNYRIGDITLLRNKSAFVRNGEEINLQEVPYKILLFLVESARAAPGRKVTVEKIAAHIWPIESARDRNDEPLKRRLHTHIRNLRASGVNCLSKGARDGYTILHEVIEESPNALRTDPLNPHRLTLNSLIFACALTSAVTLVVTVVVRGVVTALGITLTQAPQFGFVSGVFQAVFGSLAWSVPLSLVLLKGWMSQETYPEWRSSLRLFSFLWAGVIAGAFGGLLVDIALIFAQQKETLVEAGWIQSSAGTRWSAFSVTKVGYAEPAMGIAVGFCCAAFIWLALHRPELGTLAESSGERDSPGEIGRLLYLVFRKAFAWAILLIDFPVMLTGAVAYLAIGGPVSLSRFLGEGFIIGTAGVAFSTGLLTAIGAFTHGVELHSTEAY